MVYQGDSRTHSHCIYWLVFAGYHITADGKFVTAKVLVPMCLDMCDITIIQQFFCKGWCYMDTYLYKLSFFFCLLYLLTMYHHCSKGLNANQIAFVIKKYKSQCQVGLPSEIIAHMQHFQVWYTISAARMHAPTNHNLYMGPPGQKSSLCGHVSNLGDQNFCF